MNRRLLLWSVGAIAALVVAAGAIARAAETLHIVPIVHEGEVLVSVEVNDLNVSEVREVIASGLRTTFTYDIELRMVVPAWVDRTIATAVVAISDQYDNLTRQHRLSKTVDGRVVETVVTVDESEARRWLTTLARVPLCETAKWKLGSSAARPRTGSPSPGMGRSPTRTLSTVAARIPG